MGGSSVRNGGRYTEVHSVQLSCRPGDRPFCVESGQSLAWIRSSRGCRQRRHGPLGGQASGKPRRAYPRSARAPEACATEPIVGPEMNVSFHFPPTTRRPRKRASVKPNSKKPAEIVGYGRESVRVPSPVRGRKNEPTALPTT